MKTQSEYQVRSVYDTYTKAQVEQQVSFVIVYRATTTMAITECIPAWGNIVKRKILKTLKYVNIYHVEPTGVTVHNFGHVVCSVNSKTLILVTAVLTSY